MTEWCQRSTRRIDGKIVAISVRDPAFGDYTNRDQLPPHVLPEVWRLFEDYKTFEHKQVVVETCSGRKRAVCIIREALELYRQLRRGQLKRT